MGTRVYVGNLSYHTDEAGLREACAAGGREVVSVSIVTDRMTGQPRGFAFVEFGSEKDAQAAITELHGKTLDGRTLAVNEARLFLGVLARGVEVHGAHPIDEM